MFITASEWQRAFNAKFWAPYNIAAVSREGIWCPFISEKFFSCFKPHLKPSHQPALGNSAGTTGGCRPPACLHLLLMFLFLVYPRSTLCLPETGLCLGLGVQGQQTSIHQMAEVGDSQPVGTGGPYYTKWSSHCTFVAKQANGTNVARPLQEKPEICIFNTKPSRNLNVGNKLKNSKDTLGANEMCLISHLAPSGLPLASCHLQTWVQ